MKDGSFMLVLLGAMVPTALVALHLSSWAANRSRRAQEERRAGAARLWAMVDLFVVFGIITGGILLVVAISDYFDI